MAEALSYETLQKQIAESELGREWVQDALMRQDIWLLTDLGYSQSECEIRRLNKLYFQDFSLPWLKLLAKLTARARARERHSLDWVHRQVRSLYQLECFMTSQGYFQPEDLSNELLQQFIVGPNGLNHRYSVAYAIQLWKEEGWLNLQFIPPKRNRKTPEIKSIPEEVLHQIYDSFDSLPPMLERMFRLQLTLGCRITEVLTLPRNCLKREQERWFLLRWVQKRKQWQFQGVHPLVAELVQEQQKFITAQFGVNTDFNYLFCHLLAGRQNGAKGQKKGLGMTRCNIEEYVYRPAVFPKNQVNRWLRSFSEEVDLKDKHGNRFYLSSHMFRRTKASIMAYCEIEDEYIAAVLGHTSLDMLPHYRKRSLERLEKNAQLLELTVSAVNAQTKVTIEPEDLTIAGSRHQVATRLIFISPNESIKNLQVNVSARSLDRTDNLAVFPTTAIKPQPNQKQPNEIIVPVEFNLQQAPSSGEFQGKLRLSYQHEEQALPVTVGIPVTVRVKDNWFLPLAVLLVGTGLGFAVSAYRDRGQPRDEVLVRVGRLRTEMQEDIELNKAASFQTQIEAHLYDVKVGLQGDKLETARIGIEQAEQVWAKWIKGRTDWLNQFTYWEELNQRLQDLNPNIPYVQKVRREMEDASREASELEGPDKLRDRLDELAGHINRFLQVQALGKQLQNLLGQLPSEEKPNWESKILAWERQMNRIQPSELTQDASLVSEMEGAIAEMSQLIAQHSGTSAMTKGILSISSVAPAPFARPLSWERQISGAGLRLRWFTGVSYAIALLFLTGAGFNQLYVDNPTFGANPWKDYFALLAWGFGAEASRDAVTRPKTRVSPIWCSEQ